MGTYDMMLEILWTRYFLEAQGYGQRSTVVYQDNLSVMLLEKNGKMSSTKRTKHIHIRFFLIQDRWTKGELDIRYCPTDEMVADYFSKPLQGKQFLKFRALILGLETPFTD